MWRVEKVEEYLITFSSTYRALKAEKTLKNKGIEFRLAPTPGKLTAGCGLSIAFCEENKSSITGVLKEKGIKIHTFLVKRGKEYVEVS